MRFPWISAATLFASGLMASAALAITADDIVASYQADGFTAIEVTTGVTQIKVEAVKGGTKLEAVYDIESGAIVAQESKPARANDSSDDTVEVQSTDHDFTSAAGDIIEGKHGHERGEAKGYDGSVGSVDDHGGDRGETGRADDNSSSSDDGGHSGESHSGKDGSGKDNSGHGGSDDDSASDDSSDD